MGGSTRKTEYATHIDECQVFLAQRTGYLIKDSMFEELIHAIDAVARGEAFVRPAVTHILVNTYIDRRSDGAALDEQKPRLSGCWLWDIPLRK